MNTRQIATYILTSAGLLVTSWLTYLHVKLHTDFTYSSFCGQGETFNCETVASSAYAVILSLPTSVWGALAYTALLILVLFDKTAKDEDENKGTVHLQAILAALMACGSVAFAVISMVMISANCVLCLTNHLVAIALVFVTVLEAKNRRKLGVSVAIELRNFKHQRAVPIYLCAVLAIGIGAGPGGLLPRYWTYAAYRTDASLESGVDDEGRPWLGATSPKTVVHEYLDYECPACRISHKKIRYLLGSNPSEIRLVRHEFPRQYCFVGKSEKIAGKCAVAVGAFCAGKQGKFWAWNDAVMSSPKPMSGPDRKSFERTLAEKLQLDLPQFEKCYSDPASGEAVDAEYKDARKKKISEVPTYMVDDEFLSLEELQNKVQ